MTRESKPIHVSRLLPGLDFGLLLIVLMCGTAGLQWLTASSEARPREQALLPTSREDMASQLNATQSELERLRQELADHQALAAELRRQLKEAEATHPDLDAIRVNRGVTNQTLDKLRQNIEALDKELQQLQQQERDLQQQRQDLEKRRGEIAAINKTLVDLRKELDSLKSTNKSLAAEITEIKNLPPNYCPIHVDFAPEFTHEKNRHPINVALTESTVAPIQEPYYTGRLAGTRIVISRVRTGKTAKEALAAGSDFSKLLKELDPKKNYVFMLVDSASFETLRTVRDELEKRKIPWGWEPWDDVTTLNVPAGNTPPPDNGQGPGTMR